MMRGNRGTHPLECFDPPEGLVFHPGRNQPWTVWFKGKVLRFESSPSSAEATYRHAVDFQAKVNARR